MIIFINIKTLYATSQLADNVLWKFLFLLKYKTQYQYTHFKPKLLVILLMTSK